MKKNKGGKHTIKGVVKLYEGNQGRNLIGLYGGKNVLQLYAAKEGK